MSKQVVKKSKKPAAVAEVPEKKKLPLDGLPTTEAADDEPKKKKVIKKVKNGKDEKDNDKPKKPTNKNTKKESSDKAVNNDNEEEKDIIIKKKPAAATAPPTKKSIFVKKECSEEKRAQLAERLKSVNEQIKSFRTLGYLTASNGTLYYPVQTVLEPTGIDIEITIQDRSVLVNTGENRDGNTTLRALHGKWIFAQKQWALPLTSLPDLRKYFNVVEERKLTKEELEELKEQIQKAREDKMKPGEITVTDEGDFLLLTSPTAATKNISEELKQQCRGTWNPSQKAWVVNKTYKEELENLLEEAEKEGKITKYEFVSGVLAGLGED